MDCLLHKKKKATPIKAKTKKVRNGLADVLLGIIINISAPSPESSHGMKRKLVEFKTYLEDNQV